MRSRLTRRGCWSWGLLLAFALVCALGSSGRAQASGATPLGVTYTGPASAGGSITLALSSDQSQVLWISLDSVNFPSNNPYGTCGGSLTETGYSSPPQAVTSGQFQTGFDRFHAVTSVQGQVDSSTSLSGTAYGIYYPIGCTSQTITWTASIEGATPPAKLDHEYLGTVGPGTMTVWTGAGGTIGAITLDGLEELPCSNGYGPVGIRATFDPQPAIQSSSLQLNFIQDWGWVLVQASRPTLQVMEATLSLTYPWNPGPCVFSWSGALVGDNDGDGCTDVQEQQTGPGSELTGGRRNDLNPNDYFNPSHDGLNRIDDVLLAVLAYFKDAFLDPPINSIPNPAYDPDADRTYVGPLAWNLGAADGLQRIDDVLNQLHQYFHDCL